MRQFHEAGAAVVIADLADDRAGKLADELGERAVYARTDVNDDHAARDLSPVGVRVCCIAPGTMRTPIMESVGDEKLAAFARDVPFPKRLGKPEAYGKLARHIAENDYLNGEVIRLDGAQRFGLR